MQKDFWQGKKVFITGHTGFKGSWLTLWLKQRGANIIGYSLAPQTVPNLFSCANVAEGINSITGNILDLEHLKKSVLAAQPEIIFHLAAQPLVHYSYQNPIETYSVNVMGTVHLLEAIRYVDSVRSVVVVTSDKCYENREWIWGYRETDAMGGYDPYSSSKGCTELVVSAYRQSYFHANKYHEHGVGLASARAGNVIGGGDWAADRLIPDIIRALNRNEISQIRNPNACRPWQYILDVLQGYLVLAEHLWFKGIEYTGAWNFGPSDDNVKSVRWIADKLTTLWNKKEAWEISENHYPHEAMLLKLDSNKARNALSWQPKMSIHELLTHTCAWYNAFYQQHEMGQFTESQIVDFERKRMA